MRFSRAILVWLLILVLAILNGALREAVFMPRMSLAGAYFASGLLLSLIIIGVALASAGWLGITSVRRGLFVGMLWLLLTLVFELGFGRWGQLKSWEELMGAYTFDDGNIWPLVLLVTLLAPVIAGKFHLGVARK